MADYFTSFSCRLDLRSTKNVAQAISIYEEQRTAVDRDEGPAIGFEIKVDPKTSSALLISDGDGSGEPEHVIAFVLRCAETFGLEGRWGFVWGLWCSSSRLDGFGGGAQVLDLGARKSLAWTDCDHWLAAMLDPAVDPDEGLVFA